MVKWGVGIKDVLGCRWFMPLAINDPSTSTNGTNIALQDIHSLTAIPSPKVNLQRRLLPAGCIANVTQPAIVPELGENRCLLASLIWGRSGHSRLLSSTCSKVPSLGSCWMLFRACALLAKR